MKQLVQFLRSVIPADPTQLIFLFGVICLTVAPHLRWWPTDGSANILGLFDDTHEPGRNARIAWRQFLSTATYPIIFAGAAGYFVCFWPAKHAIRRILWGIYLPATAGFGLICGRFLYLYGRTPSVFDNGWSQFHGLHRTLATLWNLGTGLHFCLLGLLLVAVFVSRMAFGIAFLPISLPQTRETDASWHRTRVLSWFLVAPYALLVSLVFVVATLSLSPVVSYLSGREENAWVFRSATFVGIASSVAIAALLLGAEGWPAVRRSLRRPTVKDLFLGLFFSLGIAALISIGHYLFDRVQWAARDFGRNSAPEFGSYFNLPDPWLLFLFFDALSEEIIFRGLLQPRFIKRYGLYRGIFLVGLVWGAFHFFTDTYSGLSDSGVFLRLVSRVFACLALSFVLGWLALRTRSVLPAAVAHTLYNVLVFSGFGPPFTGKDTVRVVLWAGLAGVLFYYWPARMEDELDVFPTAANPEPVV